MSDFAATYAISRLRLDDAIKGLTQAQLNWRLHEESLTIAEMALHVAGVEIRFASRLLDLELDPELSKLSLAAVDGSINSNPFPFTEEEMTPELVKGLLAKTRDIVESLMESPSEAVLAKEITSALGPVITGRGALARLSFHPAYHHGQAYLISTAPGFPSA